MNADGRTDRNRGWKIGLTQNDEVLIRETEHKNITKYSRDRTQKYHKIFEKQNTELDSKIFERQTDT